MHRSTRPFFSFQPAHRILSPLAADRLASAPCASNSRSHKSIDSLASDSDAPGSRTGNNRRDKMMADSRPESPTWDELPSNMVPLLSIGNRAMGGSAAPTRSHTLLSRTPSPYPPMAGADIGASGSNLNAARLNLGPRSDFDKGKLGWWMWNTQRGWIFLVGLLVAFYAGSGLMRLIQNQFILRTGVYKFAYPVTTTLLELIVTQLMLVLTASLTRTFSRILNSHGLSHLIAPEATPPKGKQRAGALAWSTSTWGDWGSTGIFGLDLELARRILPLAVIYTAKLILSNLSFAYALRQIYQLSRLATIPLTVLFTYIWANQNPSLSVTTLSSTLTLTFALAMVSLQPPFLVTWEGVVAGVFSSFFVAGYPVLLLNTYNRVLEYHSPMYDEVLIESTSTMYFQGDGKSPARSHWKLLLYTNMMAIILTLPWIFISGEAGNISRNCYILDIPWFWLMILVGGIASWGVFVGGWMLVKATTPLTGNVVGGVRVAVQSVLLSGFRLPEWSWTGAVMAISSGVWYLLGRRREVGVTWGEGEVMWEGERDRDDSETVGNWAENQRNV